MISGSIISGNSIGSTGGIAVKSVLSAGQCSITCGSAGGDGLIVEKRSQCDGSASDGNLTASGFSFSTGSAGGVGGGGVGGGCGGGGGGCGV